MMTARVFLAVTLLLILVASSIALPAAANGPLCTLACCAGRAPHAAGSCMHGSCGSGLATHNPSSNVPHQAHHHHEQQPAEESDQTSAFPGATASVGASEMGDVPTIEATPYEVSADDGGQADTTEAAANRSNDPAITASVLSKSCQPDCGACTSGFAAQKRSRNVATLAGSNHAPPPWSLQLAGGRHSLTHPRSALGRQSVPRGPPLFFSC
jgi:hypothetical protein